VRYAQKILGTFRQAHLWPFTFVKSPARGCYSFFQIANISFREARYLLFRGGIDTFKSLAALGVAKLSVDIHFILIHKNLIFQTAEIREQKTEKINKEVKFLACRCSFIF